MAHRTLWLASLSLAALTACSQPEGTGFSGVSSEVQTVTSANFGQPTLAVAPTVRSSNATIRQDIPQITARSKSTSTHIQAEEAILIADKKNRVSESVQMNGQDLRISVVWVNRSPFAVLRPKSAALRSDSSNAFHRQVQSMTGCPAASGVYVYDKNRKRDGVTGMAVALGCVTG